VIGRRLEFCISKYLAPPSATHLFFSKQEGTMAPPASTGNKNHKQLRLMRRQKQASKKKEKTKKKKRGAPNLSVDELLQAADHAMTSGQDPERAVALYTAALQKTEQQQRRQQQQQQKQSRPPSSGGGDLEERSETALADILERRAEVYVSMARQEAALADYQSALVLHLNDEEEDSSGASDESPELLERKASLYMYIGQLSTSERALESYRKGIECFQRALEHRQARKDASDSAASENMNIVTVEDRDAKKDSDDTNKQRQKALQQCQRQLVTAYCTMAELYLTDLCYEENAETECEAYVERALQLSGGKELQQQQHLAPVDVLQLKASLRLSQQRGGEAVDLMLAVAEQMATGCQALATLVGLREPAVDGEAQSAAKELTELGAVQDLPGFEFRCQTVKLLLECAGIPPEHQETSEEEAQEAGKRQQCAQAAIDVVGSLLAENDEVIEIWCLAGDASAALQETAQAAEYWQRGLDMLTAVHESLEQQQQQFMMSDASEEEEDDVQQQLDEVICQIEELRTKLDEVGQDEGQPMEE
jgi:hypothetical protein